jgi:hypothetical protein
MEKDWVTIYSSSQLYKVEMAKQLLEQEGIEVVELNQQDSSFNAFGEIKLIVAADIQQQALEILKQIEP